jgi:hypothetical protein
VDSLILLLVVAGIFALPFLKQRWSLIASYIIGGCLALYGIATIVPNLFDPNHLSGLAYILGAILVLVGGGMVGLARYLYRAKQSNR